MTREEAIERIKSRYDKWALDDKDLEAIQCTFPELKESEEERIRKQLVDIVAFIPEANFQSASREDCRAYLEKQKESLGDFIDDFPYSDQKEQKPAVKQLDGTFNSYDMAKTFAEGQHYVMEHPEKFGLCKKPAEIDEYEIIKKHITRDSLSSEVNKRLKECGWYVTDEKLVEWSEDIIRKAVKEVGLTQHQIDWFKTNVFPPKQGWGEEDEDMLNCCISSIEEAKENRYYYRETDGDTSYDHEISWLKSLRSQPKQNANDIITPNKKFFQWIYDRLVNVHKENPNVDYMRSFKRRIEELSFDEPHLKINKEQMDALKNVAYGYYQEGDGFLLHELHEQLKKLM